MPHVCDWPDCMMIVASCFSVYRRFVSCTEFIMPFYLVRGFLPFHLMLLSGHPVLFLLRDISKIPGRNWLA